MHLTLQFEGNIIRGAGIDGPGPFAIIGTCDAASAQLKFAKAYIGKHTVNYEGALQNDEITGTWSLTQNGRLMQGQMRLWPLPDGLYRDDEPLAAMLQKEIDRKG